MALKKKPIKWGSTPEPDNPRVEPGSFVIQGKAWYDEDGVMVIDEDGEIPDEIEEDLVLRGNCMHEITYRKDGTTRTKPNPSYELRWCPVAKKSKNACKR